MANLNRIISDQTESYLSQLGVNTSPIIILGAGINGLSVALELIAHRYSNICILSSHFPPFTTSDGAGGLWFPYKASPMERVLSWSMTTKRILLSLLKYEGAPITLAPGYWYEAGTPTEGGPWWKEIVDDFKVLPDNEVPSIADYGFSCAVPVIETYKYLQWMLRCAVSGGCKLIKAKVSSINDTIQTYKPHAIINCLGLSSGELFNDKQVYPIRGVLVKVQPLHPVEQPNKWIVFDSDPLGTTYIIPRNDVIIMGGTGDAHVWDTTPSDAALQKIKSRTLQLVPSLKNTTVVAEWSGLRPYRTEVRLEIDSSLSDNVLLIHNYGHGGSGWTTHWGCALEVIKLLQSRQHSSSKSKL